jgi:hypothetical protein
VTIIFLRRNFIHEDESKLFDDKIPQRTSLPDWSHKQHERAFDLQNLGLSLIHSLACGGLVGIREVTSVLTQTQMSPVFPV